MRLGGGFSLICLLVSMPAFSATFQLSVTSTTVAECEPDEAYVSLTNDEPVQAFSFGVAHDPAVAALTEIDYTDCPVIEGLNGGSGPDYFQADMDAGTGHCGADITAGGTAYCIVSHDGPETEVIPVGTDQPILRLSYEAAPGAVQGSESSIEIVPCLGDVRPWAVVIVVEGLRREPTLSEGTISVGPSACLFSRGDTNHDSFVDIADVVTILLYLFGTGTSPLRCEDAADTNDDGAVDVGDAIRLLSLLFGEGIPLAAPFEECGTDPTPDELDCRVSVCEVGEEPEPPATMTITLPGDVPLEMIYCPPGSFMMGAYPGEQDSRPEDHPQHEVTLTKGYYLGKYEVTKRQWDAVMETRPWAGQEFVLNDPDSPAVYLSWDDSQEFVAAVSALGQGTFRLPTEAEWEYACRAGTTTRFYWGEDPDHTEIGDYAWWKGNALNVNEKHAHVVGQKSPNAWGLHDMSGNAWEWCEDWYDADYYSVSPDTDPPGPAGGTYRVLHAGSWDNSADRCRSAARARIEPSSRLGVVGLRIASSVTP